MKNAYYINVDKAKIPLETYEYPCEAVNDQLLKKHTLCFWGDNDYYGIQKSFTESGCLITEDLCSCTDLVIFPSRLSKENANSETYFEELFHYHNPAEKCLASNSKIQNIIFILPYGAGEFSTNYKHMADNATVTYAQGISFRRAKSKVRAYDVHVSKVIDPAKFKGVLLYLLSNNSNHLIGQSIQVC